MHASTPLTATLAIRVNDKICLHLLVTKDESYTPDDGVEAIVASVPST